MIHITFHKNSSRPLRPFGISGWLHVYFWRNWSQKIYRTGRAKTNRREQRKHKGNQNLNVKKNFLYIRRYLYRNSYRVIFIEFDTRIRIMYSRNFLSLNVVAPPPFLTKWRAGGLTRPPGNGVLGVYYSYMEEKPIGLFMLSNRHYCYLTTYIYDATWFSSASV